MGKLQKVKDSTDFLDKSLEVIAITCLMISVFGAAISVFLRYALGLSFQVIEEICRYVIIYGAFAYVGPLIKKNEHLKMDILQDLLKEKGKCFVNVMISLLLFAAFTFLCWSSFNWTISLLSMQIKTASGIMLMFIPALAIPIGMLLGCLYAFLQLVLDFGRLRYRNGRMEAQHLDSKVDS